MLAKLKLLMWLLEFSLFNKILLKLDLIESTLWLKKLTVKTQFLENPSIQLL